MHRIPQRTQLEPVLDAAMRIDQATGAALQVFDAGEHALVLLAYSGLPPEFGEHFKSTREDDGSSCAQAMAERRRVVVRDVDQDPGFENHRDIAHRCGFRAVQSTPLIGRDHHLLGMLSTYFADPHHPSTAAFKDLDLCCRVATLLLEVTELKDEVAELDRESGMPFRSLSPAAAHAADAARMLLPLLGQDERQVLLAKVVTNLEIVANELATLRSRLVTP